MSTKLVDDTFAFVKEKFSEDKTGHDWWHIYRVLKLAQRIADDEPAANPEVVELAALLHDIADWKFHDGDITAGPRAAREWLERQQAAPEVVDAVAYVVEHISYRGGTNKHVMQTLEGKIVQDADRLDALGAIGLARVFIFGGSRGRPLYDPEHAPETHMSFDSYRSTIDQNTCINHFYEKLLKLKDGMHTKTAKQLAEHRHKILEDYLDEFYKEWEGER